MASGEEVEAIGAEVGITQAAVSQQPQSAAGEWLCTGRAEAQRRLYSVDAAELQAVDEWIGQFRSFWEPKLGARWRRRSPRGKRERRGAPMAGQTGRRA